MSISLAVVQRRCCRILDRLGRKPREFSKQCRWETCTNDGRKLSVTYRQNTTAAGDRDCTATASILVHGHGIALPGKKRNVKRVPGATRVQANFSA